MQVLTSFGRDVDDYIQSPAYAGKVRLVIGPRGCGKTFAILKVLRDKIREQKDLLPIVLIFKQTGDIKPLNPGVLASPEVWGERQKSASAGNVKEYLARANVVVFDDIHYICEAVKNREYPVDRFVDFLEEALEKTQLGKRVILVSDTQLSAYSHFIEDTRFVKLLPRFGMYTGDYRRDSKVDILSVTYPIPLSRENLEKLFDQHGVAASSIFKSFLLKATHNPRAFVRIARIFGHDITLSQFIEEVIKRRENYDPGFLLSVAKTCEAGLPPRAYVILNRLQEGDISKEFKIRIGKLRRLAAVIKRSPKISVEDAMAYLKISYREREAIRSSIAHYIENPNKFSDISKAISKANHNMIRICRERYRTELKMLGEKTNMRKRKKVLWDLVGLAKGLPIRRRSEKYLLTYWGKKCISAVLGNGKLDGSLSRDVDMLFKESLDAFNQELRESWTNS